MGNRRRTMLESLPEMALGVFDAATQVSIIATDSEGIIQVFSPGAERMLQYPASEMEGIRTPEIIHDPAEWAERFHAIRENARRGESEEGEWTYVRKDGARIDVSLSIKAISGPDGVFQGFLFIATDITARKSAEEANRAKSEFLAAMSHEIRTPMNAILGMTDLLRESQLDAGQIQYVDVIRTAGANLLALIGDILDLSKIEAGHLELERIEFPLEEVIDDAVDLVSLKARAKGLSLTCHTSPDVSTALVGDPNRLRQVLLNLLGNAVKFTDSGGIELSIRNHESGRPGEIEFSIADTGIGIPADKLETIFRDFTQADASMARKYGGSGLGLGISRRLVEALNGRLTAISEVGKGSTFRFNALFEPASEGPRKPPLGIEELRPDAGGGKEEKSLHILLAEDSRDNRLLMQAYLKGTPHRLDIAEDGKAAVDRFSTEEFDLILMDVQMPVMDGLAATRAIRSIERERGAGYVPIVALTAHARLQDVETSREAGCDAHFSKPISKVKLLEVIAEHGHRSALETIVAARETISIEIPQGLEELVPDYLEWRRQEVPDLLAVLAVSDFERLAQMAHNIKGSGAAYGFADLTRIGAALEIAATQKDASGSGAQLRRLSDYLDRVRVVAPEVRDAGEAFDDQAAPYGAPG